MFANVCPSLPDVRFYPTLPYGERHRLMHVDDIDLFLQLIKVGTKTKEKTSHMVGIHHRF